MGELPTTAQVIVTTGASTQGGNDGEKQTRQGLEGWLWYFLILIACIVIVGILLVIKYRDKLKEE